MPSSRYPSITIPPGFRFHYRDGQLPRTPEPGESHELHEAPPAPRQSSRRKSGERPAIPRFSPPAMLTALHDLPIPTIEHESPESVLADHPTFEQPTNDFFLAPRQIDLGMFAAPKTPVPQMESQDMDYLDIKSQGESISRPSTACSNFSDSSMSSMDDDEGSLESFPSFGADSVSPKSEDADPFTAKSSSPHGSLVSSPTIKYQGPPKSRIRTTKKFIWNDEMDRHLWRTFLLYLNDPEHTPFKLFPGTHPPLGVCHRVARAAKKTWRSAKSHDMNASRSRQIGSPDTICHIDAEATPMETSSRASVAKWPPNATTRRRLRELCKGKPSLSAHYQRLMQNRSPSPFESSSSSDRVRMGASSESHRRTPSMFNTRDMSMSLVATTSSAMQSGNPLSNLAAGSMAPPHDTPHHTFRPVSRGNAHQKSYSLQLGIEANRRSGNLRRLGSPFQAQTHHLSLAPRNQTIAASTVAAQQLHPVRTLAPAAELHSPVPLARASKRRARGDTGESSNAGAPLSSDWLQDVFGAPAESSHRRVRSRGFSLGDMHEMPRRLSVFSQATQRDSTGMISPTLTEATNPRPAPLDHASQQRALLLLPEVPPRLGSPFAPNAQEKPYNTMPRLAPSAPYEPALSFEERLSVFAPGRVSKTGGRSFQRAARGHPRPSLEQFLRSSREQQ